jgi:hypothetical protein
MTVNITLAFPEAMIEKIDRNRGDVNRSRFVLRLIEFAYEKQRQNKKLQQSVGSQVGTSQTSIVTAEPVSTETVLKSDSHYD